MLNKTERLKSAYKNLMIGKAIEFIADDGTRRCRCYVAKGKNMIEYTCFDDGEINFTLSNLKWVANNIGKCTTYRYDIVGR